MELPDIKTLDWIRVGSHDCVVRVLYSDNSQSGTCQVVFNKDKPTTHDVCWNGTDWIFSERPDYGGYASNSCPAVRVLKKGRYA